jgi:hypothetical protein
MKFVSMQMGPSVGQVLSLTSDLTVELPMGGSVSAVGMHVRARLECCPTDCCFTYNCLWLVMFDNV